jgi:hypothetical protein
MEEEDGGMNPMVWFLAEEDESYHHRNLAKETITDAKCN